MNDSPRFDVVALAGGTLEADFRRAGYSVANKAYLPLAGSTMLERVLSSLRVSDCVRKIRCVTLPEAFGAAFGSRTSGLCDEVIPAGAGLIDSLLAGCDGLDSGQRVIVAATDIPLLTPRAADAFARRAALQECDVAYGCVRKEPHERLYPQVRHTWVRLKEGTFCGGGLSMLRVGAVIRLAALLRSFAAARKSPLKLASLFSPLLVLRLLLGRLSIAELERHAARISHLQCRAVACDEPELAVNVDCLGDLRAVEAILSGPGGSRAGGSQI